MVGRYPSRIWLLEASSLRGEVQEAEANICHFSYCWSSKALSYLPVVSLESWPFPTCQAMVVNLELALGQAQRQAQEAVIAREIKQLHCFVGLSLMARLSKLGVPCSMQLEQPWCRSWPSSLEPGRPGTLPIVPPRVSHMPRFTPSQMHVWHLSFKPFKPSWILSKAQRR